MKAVIRVKVSHLAGFGHWIRQCHLARALNQAGWQVTMFPDTYEHLGATPTNAGLTPVKDNDEFLERLPDSVDLAILDIHKTTPELISAVRSSARVVAGFEDLGSGRDRLDCLIDCNLPTQSSKDVDDKVVTLFGWDYSLLAPEYESASKEPRDFSRGIQSLLVTMGGTDPNNLTASVALSLLENFPELKVSVVSGPGFISDDTLGNVFKHPQVTLLERPKSLAPLFLAHDAVVCAGGVTLHEALAAGTPAFVVPQVEHQEVLTLGLQERGAASLVGQPGKLNPEALFKAIQTSPENLRTMSSTGRELIDGRGLQRIVHFLSNYPSK